MRGFYQRMHAYPGIGPVKLLNHAAGLNTLFFTKATGGPASIQVLVGCLAT
ncbi:MAG TPA: hypothetical protein VK864_05515 [Longimicrobiales bacterium]|nr:hypothetical protein [Longimicrobiales bacterium]